MRVIDDANPALRVVRAVLAALVVASIVRQLFVVFAQPDPSPVNFFSFFTIQVNLLAGAVWLLGAWKPQWIATRPMLRGAATAYLLITGAVYFVLSFDPNKDVLLELTAWWVNALTHQVLPLAALIEWILVPPHRRIGPRAALTWLLYPAGFFVYSMARGFMTGWYPYPFLQPGYWNGYSGVLLNASILLAMMIPIVLAVGWLGSRRAATRGRVATGAGKPVPPSDQA